MSIDFIASVYELFDLMLKKAILFTKKKHCAMITKVQNVQANEQHIPVNNKF